MTLQRSHVTRRARPTAVAHRRARTSSTDLVASRHHGSGPVPLGPGRRGRGRQAPRLDRGGRDLAPARAPRSTRCATSSRAAGRRPHRARAAWAARRSPPRSSRAPTASSSPCSTPPTPARCSRALDDRLDRDRARRLVEVRLDRRDRQPAPRLREGLPRRRHRPARAHRRRHRPGLAARRVGPRGRLPRLQRRPQRRRPLLGAHRLRPRAVAASPASTSASCSTRRRPISLELAHRRRRQPGPRSWAPRSPAPSPLRDKLGIVADGTHIVGFADWAEQLIAESTGKHGTGLLPVVLDDGRPRARPRLRRPADRAPRRRRRADDLRDGRTTARSASAARLGAQFLVWEYATAVAGRLLGINPFDQPDVESAKIATRGLLDARPEPPSRRPSSTAASRCAARPTVIDGVERPRRRPSTPCSASSAADGYLVDPGLRRPRRLPAARRAARRCSPRASDAPSPSAGDRGSCTRPASTTRAAPPIGVFLQITQTRREPTSRSRSARSRSASSSRRRPPATRACSPSTVAPCSAST